MGLHATIRGTIALFRAALGGSVYLEALRGADGECQDKAAWTLNDIYEAKNSSITTLFNHVCEKDSKLQDTFKNHLDLEKEAQKFASLNINRSF